MKCLVKNCPNDSSQGVFVDKLCHPCHDFLKTGRGGKFMPKRILGDEFFPKFPELDDIIKSIHTNEYFGERDLMKAVYEEIKERLKVSE